MITDNIFRYVVAVGWDKRVNIYSDSTDSSIHHIQHPAPNWHDDVVCNSNYMSYKYLSALF